MTVRVQRVSASRNLNLLRHLRHLRRRGPDRRLGCRIDLFGRRDRRPCHLAAPFRRPSLYRVKRYRGLVHPYEALDHLLCHRRHWPLYNHELQCFRQIFPMLLGIGFGNQRDASAYKSGDRFTDRTVHITGHPDLRRI